MITILNEVCSLNVEVSEGYINLFGTLYMRKSNDCRKFYQSLLFSIQVILCLLFWTFVYAEDVLDPIHA